MSSIIYLNNMRDWVVKKRLNNILGQGKFNASVVQQLFEEYEQDKANNIPNEESEARAILILGNSSLVSHVLMRKFYFEYANCELEEFSVGKMGLIKAVDTYNVSQGVKFSTYAYRVIYNEILMYYRKQSGSGKNAEREKISLEECFLPDSRSEVLPQYAEALSEPPTFVEDILNEDFMRNLKYHLIHLMPVEQISLVYSYGLYNNETLRQWEIAQKVGKSRSAISKAVTSGLNKLKILLTQNDLLDDEQRIFKYRILREFYPLEDCIKSYFCNLSLK